MIRKIGWIAVGLGLGITVAFLTTYFAPRSWVPLTAGVVIAWVCLRMDPTDDRAIPLGFALSVALVGSWVAGADLHAASVSAELGQALVAVCLLGGLAMGFVARRPALVATAAATLLWVELGGRWAERGSGRDGTWMFVTAHAIAFVAWFASRSPSNLARGLIIASLVALVAVAGPNLGMRHTLCVAFAGAGGVAIGAWVVASSRPSKA